MQLNNNNQIYTQPFSVPPYKGVSLKASDAATALDFRNEDVLRFSGKKDKKNLVKSPRQQYWQSVWQPAVLGALGAALGFSVGLMLGVPTLGLAMIPAAIVGTTIGVFAPLLFLKNERSGDDATVQNQNDELPVTEGTHNQSELKPLSDKAFKEAFFKWLNEEKMTEIAEKLKSTSADQLKTQPIKELLAIELPEYNPSFSQLQAFSAKFNQYITLFHGQSHLKEKRNIVTERIFDPLDAAEKAQFYEKTGDAFVDQWKSEQKLQAVENTLKNTTDAEFEKMTFKQIFGTREELTIEESEKLINVIEDYSYHFCSDDDQLQAKLNKLQDWLQEEKDFIDAKHFFDSSDDPLLKDWKTEENFEKIIENLSLQLGVIPHNGFYSTDIIDILDLKDMFNVDEKKSLEEYGKMNNWLGRYIELFYEDSESLNQRYQILDKRIGNLLKQQEKEGFF